MAFLLHEKLAADCEPLGELELCTALLMRDHRFPWVVLVPRIANLRDFHDLPRQHAPTLFDEIEAVSTALVETFAAEKINVAALGNQVPQLHVHVIGRYANDAAWPAPVWSAGAVAAVDHGLVAQRAEALRQALAGRIGSHGSGAGEAQAP